MKAIVRTKFGSPDVVSLQELEQPPLSDDGVLVRVRAASVNPADWYGIAGTPLIARPMVGIFRPRAVAVGVDFAGTVEAIGKDVSQFRVGDEVFGGRDGAFAEYVVVREERAVVKRPANVTVEQAASVGVAALTALQGLRDKGGVQPGNQVLINGASGGVGTFAVQIAKWLGAEVTAVSVTFFIAKFNKADLQVLADLMHAGKVTPVIDRTYPLTEIADALRYLGEGHAQGKIVVTV